MRYGTRKKEKGKGKNRNRKQFCVAIKYFGPVLRQTLYYNGTDRRAAYEVERWCARPAVHDGVATSAFRVLKEV